MTGGASRFDVGESVRGVHVSALLLKTAAARSSVVQFHYGEDGIDVMNNSFLREFGFYARNVERLAQQQPEGAAEHASVVAGLTAMEKEANKMCRSAAEAPLGLCHRCREKPSCGMHRVLLLSAVLVAKQVAAETAQQEGERKVCRGT